MPTCGPYLMATGRRALLAVARPVEFGHAGCVKSFLVERVVHLDGEAKRARRAEPLVAARGGVALIPTSLKHPFPDRLHVTPLVREALRADMYAMQRSAEPAAMLQTVALLAATTTTGEGGEGMGLGGWSRPKPVIRSPRLAQQKAAVGQ